MMRREKKQTAKTGEIISKSVDFEVTIADIARRSEKRAWWTAFSAILMALILACGYFLMLPLKEKVPYLVMADAYTGTSTVAKLRMDFNTNTIFSSEAINKSNVSHFVVARESFDRDNLIRRRDWTTVNAMAAPNIRQVYRTLFDRSNPENLFTAYSGNEAIRVVLISVQLAGQSKIQVGQKDAPQSSATVRFQRLLFNKENGTSKVLDTNIAAIQFTYRDDLEMEEPLRMENPLGFWVTGYRVDKEFVSSPPPQQIEEATMVPADAATPAGAAVTDPAAANPAAPGTPGTANPAAPAANPATTQPSPSP
jgi:type IV secretion system protein VirB8